MFVCQYGSHQNKPHQNRIILNFSHMFIEEKKLKNQNLKKRKMPTNHKKFADSEYQNEQLDLTLKMPWVENYAFMPWGGEFDPPLRSQLVVVRFSKC